MKRKIIIAFSVFSLIFIPSGLYIIATIEEATARLDMLIRLHRVEILREQLLIRIKRAQSDLNLRNTRHARSMDAVVTDVRAMDGALGVCFSCHHAESVRNKLVDLKNRSDQYKNALSRVITLRANRDRMESEKNAAFGIGADLISEVDAITMMADRKLEERTRSTLQDIWRTKTIVFIILAATPIAALGFFIIFLRGFTRPVGALLIATRRLKAGDLSYRIEGLQDEYGEVAASFNDMAATLKDHFIRMQWAEQSVVLGQLAGGLAHEINNPLAGIRGVMEVLVRDPSCSGENKQVLLQALDQTTRIERILKSFLHFARPPEPQLENLNMNDVLDAVISLAEKHPLFSSKSGRAIWLVKNYDPALPAVKADLLQLQQVFLNLLLNAAGAMQAGGYILVSTSYADMPSSVSIMVKDAGKGIDNSAIDKIFLPFFTTKPKGTGLGLATTKRLVEQLGGRIHAANDPDGGAVFVVTFPV